MKHNNKNKDLVSIIIPCYNQAQYLEEAVQSAVDQTYPSIEIIIVNDGSLDNTQEVAEKLQKKYLKKIQVVSQKNSGVSKARNNGIQQSQGQYILPLDADDLIDKSMISSCLKSMGKNDADIVYVNVQCFGLKKMLVKRVPFIQNNILYQNLCPVSSLFKKKIWEQLGGYAENMKEGYEDWEFWIHAFKQGFKFQLLSEPFLHYRTQEISRDTIASNQDTYLKAKITLNHPELYTTHQVHTAISIIKETEKLPNLHFYYSEDLSIDEVTLSSCLDSYLVANKLQQSQLLPIPYTDKKVALYSLETMENCIQSKKLHKETEADFILFYAPLRYEVPSLKNLDFTWDQDKGIIEAHGSIFPFVFKSKRENNELQLLAYQRELKYLKYKSTKDNETVKKKLDSLRHKYNMDIDVLNKKIDNFHHKYHIDINDTQKKLATITNRYNLMMESISNLIEVPAKRKPLQKISAYKSLTKMYFELRKAENETK